MVLSHILQRFVLREDASKSIQRTAELDRDNRSQYNDIKYDEQRKNILHVYVYMVFAFPPARV